MNNNWKKDYPLAPNITEESIDDNTSLKKMLRLVGENKRVVDFGCATGYFAQLLTHKGCNVVGVEINPDAAKVAEQYCENVIIADLDLVSLADILPEQEFDVAVFGDILEHLRDPWRVLKETRKLLKSDGYVVASIPNIAHGSIRLALLQGKFDYTDLGILDNTHLRFFTKQTIDKLFQHSGYFIDSIDRTKLSIFSDVPYIPQINRNDFNSEFIKKIEQEEEAETFQFIVRAYYGKQEYKYAELNGKYFKVIEQLEQSRSQLQHKQVELEHSQFYLQESLNNIQVEREQFQLQLQQTQIQLEDTQLQLQQTQTEKERSQLQLQQTQTQLEHIQSQLQQTQTEKERSQLQLQQTQTQLEHIQSQLQQTQTEKERSQLQLQQTQIQFEHIQSQLQQTQTEKERSQFYLQETFDNIKAERKQFQSQLQHTQAELEQLKNEGIKALVKKLKTKGQDKFIRAISIFKSEGFIGLIERIKKKLETKKDTKELLQDKSLLSLSGISCKDFWIILNPVFQEKMLPLGQSPPKISILTPTWNSSLDWFIETALSVLNQSMQDWEWCIVDDGSTDTQIRSVLIDLANKHPRIKVVLQESGGISSATNKALQIANGHFVCFLDHDDTLAPMALQESIDKLSDGFDVVYSDEDKIDYSGLQYIEKFFKPDWSSEYFRGVMYVGHLLCVRRDLAIAVGGLKSEYDGVQDYEFMLRISEVTKNIGHIPKILYHWRKVQGSIAADPNAKPKIEQLQQNAVNAHLERIKLPAKAKSVTGNHRLKIVPLPKNHNPLISIIIPTKDAPQYLETCLESIFTLSTYQNYEVILIDNETTDPKALQIMERFPVKRLHFLSPFNYSKANNLGAKYAQGDYLVFLNNDTEVVTEDWLQYLLYYAEQPDIGAVGCLLLFPDKTVQHAGVVMGFRGTADHLMRGFPFNVDGYAGSLVCAREVSAITAACMMVKKSEFYNIGCFNEHFFTHYQDVDLCMRFIKNGKKNIFTPHAVLIHYESKTRKTYYDIVDRMLLLDQWQHYIDNGDPFYNPNFDLTCYNYTIRN